ncbi:hypothetical protein TL16_g00458 [Triparma laevis f. inornata]|uniref:Purple acid phosphatase n=1 Tax=Triparma laevis f. inornata TaxID=1714386 RepID=A0A9W6ZFL2_9STRA|nr:hypothetical protein TL16_g00458 [Triparma laevis f. inornata]
MFALAAISLALVAPALALPEQIHLALGKNSPYDMTVQFSDSSVSSAAVRFGSDSSNLSQESVTTTHDFTDGGDDKYKQTHHIAVMDELKPSTIYYYQVGSDEGGWSDVFDFKTAPDSTTLSSSYPLKFGIWGDMGFANSQILKAVTDEVENKNFDMILHVGDFAYDFNSNNGHNGDDFMNAIQPLAAHVPYMVDMGNHEQAYRISHYTERFRNMPGSEGTVTTDNGEAPNNWFYSHDFGNVHFVAINTEVLFVEERHEYVKKQYEFVEADLKAVNRTKTPWIVVHGHRPMYCSCDADCTFPARMVRNGGYALHRKYGLEKLLNKYGADFYLAGHEHNYERMYDVYDGKTTQTNVNPPHTVHIVTGDAGGPEEHEPFKFPNPKRTAFRTAAYGYSRMTIYNDTHIHWEQVETDTDDNVQGLVIDEVWFVQENHGPFEV